MWRDLYRDHYLLGAFKDTMPRRKWFRFVGSAFFASLFAKRSEAQETQPLVIAPPINESGASGSWKGSYSCKEGVKIATVRLATGIVSLLLSPSFVKAEKIYSSNPPMTAVFVWPPEGSYCLLPPNPGIRCRVTAIDYDEVKLKGRLLIKNLEETPPRSLLVTWTIIPQEAGTLTSSTGWEVTFTPNPFYNQGKGGSVALRATITDQHSIVARRDSALIIERAINLIPKPAIHGISVEVLTVPDNTVMLNDIPISSGQDSQVKWRLTGVRPIPSGFEVTSESWSLQEADGTKWLSFNGNPVTTDVISPDVTHRQIKITFTFTWENSITGETGSDTKSFEVPVCFWRGPAFDEWLKSPRGYTELGGVYHEPPNWFDIRPKHWADPIVGLWAKYVYYRHAFTDPVTGERQTGFFDWNGRFDPNEQNSTDYRGRIWVFSDASTCSAGDEYRLAARGIDLCGVTLAHEERHKFIFEWSWGGYTDEHIRLPEGKRHPQWEWKPGSGAFGIKGYDSDGDFIDDAHESASTDMGFNPYDPFAVREWFDGTRPNLNDMSDVIRSLDFEFDAIIRGEYRYQVGGNDSKDWCHDGKQTWLFAWW